MTPITRKYVNVIKPSLRFIKKIPIDRDIKVAISPLRIAIGLYRLVKRFAVKVVETSRSSEECVNFILSIFWKIDFWIKEVDSSDSLTASKFLKYLRRRIEKIFFITTVASRLNKSVTVDRFREKWLSNLLPWKFPERKPVARVVIRIKNSMSKQATRNWRRIQNRYLAKVLRPKMLPAEMISCLNFKDNFFPPHPPQSEDRVDHPRPDVDQYFTLSINETNQLVIGNCTNWYGIFLRIR